MRLNFIATFRRSKTKFLIYASVSVLVLSGVGVLAFNNVSDASVATVFNSPAAQPGYTLIAPTNSDNIYLVNNAGKTVHTWYTHNYPGLETKLLPDGKLLRTYDVGNTVFHMGGQGGGIQILNWDGSIAWNYEFASNMHLLHHDVAMMPNGNFLASAWVKISQKRAIAAGVNPSNIDEKTHSVWGNTIIEINPETSKIVWQWNAYDHLVQNYNPYLPNYGKPGNHQRRIDANYFKYVKKPDWLHVNAVDYNPVTDQIMISAREFNEIWVVDHSTTTAQAATSNGGRYGHGGDLLYRYGNPEAYGHGSEYSRELFLQHDAHWIEDEQLQGFGDVLVFNNGDPKGSQTYSSVLELKFPQNADGSYQMDKAGAFMPAQLVWQYAPVGKNKFFSQFMGAAQRLPNGDTLITDAMGGKAFEVNRTGKIVWSYLNRYTNEGETKNQLWRGYKYSPTDPAVANLQDDSTEGNNDIQSNFVSDFQQQGNRAGFRTPRSSSTSY